MKEFIVTFTLNGQRTMRRMWAYNAGDAQRRIRQEEKPKSQIGWIRIDKAS